MKLAIIGSQYMFMSHVYTEWVSLLAGWPGSGNVDLWGGFYKCPDCLSRLLDGGDYIPCYPPHWHWHSLSVRSQQHLYKNNNVHVVNNILNNLALKKLFIAWLHYLSTFLLSKKLLAYTCIDCKITIWVILMTYMYIMTLSETFRLCKSMWFRLKKYFFACRQIIDRLQAVSFDFI